MEWVAWEKIQQDSKNKQSNTALQTKITSAFQGIAKVKKKA